MFDSKRRFKAINEAIDHLHLHLVGAFCGAAILHRPCANSRRSCHVDLKAVVKDPGKLEGVMPRQKRFCTLPGLPFHVISCECRHFLDHH